MTPYFPLARLILPHRRQGCGLRFLIHWEGFPYSHDSWLPGSMCRVLAALILTYIPIMNSVTLSLTCLDMCICFRVEEGVRTAPYSESSLPTYKTLYIP
ncbi:hypothetical protein BD311DRAFT_670751 [Dichomitus squalens]|uniref:Chromo domain-containing protein n=1 Tax=Dichomitus squalens TaxID=114155 RepID=A0A4Q9ME83_9APHY|nr:hypothetical protein BD311DRAFT_670751 [Dichomitus squalens]